MKAPLLLLAAFLVAAGPLRADDPQGSGDPVRTRQRILARMDRQIDEAATRAHLEARLMLDEIMPLAYLGIDADPVEGGMKVTHVYPATGASDAGILEGDLLRSVDGTATPTPEVLGVVIRRHAPGDRLSMAVRRGDREIEVEATLGRRPDEDEDEEEQFPYALPKAPPVPGPLHLDLSGERLESPVAALESVLAGHGLPGRWIVLAEDGQRFLRQAEPDRTGIRFPIALARDYVCLDGRARVRFRYAGGDIDRAAGIVLRYQDPGNVVDNLRREAPSGSSAC